MRRVIRTLILSAAAVCLTLTTSCSESATDAKQPQTKKTEAKKAAEAELPNYRYVDVDTIMARYNLAKDYSEEMLRIQNQMEAEGRKLESDLTNFAKGMETKYKNNGYLSEASFNQDQETLANKQKNAQNRMAQQQSNAQQRFMQAQKNVNDSIQAYIDEYMKTHKYDAIFVKNATVYINPALDITDEIVEGLNARYNKKK